MGAPALTAGLLVASAASTAGSLSASRQQEKLDVARLNFESEQTKIRTQEQALQNTQSFRQALGSQLALSSMRGRAGGSMMRQFAANSMSRFMQDQNTFNKTLRNIDLASSLTRAQIKSGRFARDTNSLIGLVESGIGAINFNQKATQAQGNK